MKNNLSKADVNVAEAIDTLYKGMKVSSLNFLSLRIKEKTNMGFMLWVSLAGGVAGLLTLIHRHSYGSAKPIFYNIHQYEPVEAHEFKAGGREFVVKMRQHELPPLAAEEKTRFG